MKPCGERERGQHHRQGDRWSAKAIKVIYVQPVFDREDEGGRRGGNPASEIWVDRQNRIGVIQQQGNPYQGNDAGDGHWPEIASGLTDAGQQGATETAER